MSFKANPYANPAFTPTGTPTGYNISGAERLAAGALTSPSNPIHSAADATLAAAQLTDKGIEVADGSNVRVILGDLGGGDYGLKVLSSGGSTVIIDGTSDMFKIAASGTVSNTIASASSHWTDTDLSLGLTGDQAVLAFIGTTNTTGSPRVLSRLISWFVSGSTLVGVTTMDVSCYLVGSSTRVRFGGYNTTGSSVTWYAKYYVLKETAI